MADEIDDGGPAFPESISLYGGMTRRQYIATHVAVGFAAAVGPQTGVSALHHMAESAFAWADAIIKHEKREKENADGK